MPLKKLSSKEAFRENIRKLRREGRPEKQSLAIAYSVQRRAERKGKRK